MKLMVIVQVDGGRQRACGGFICLCKNVDLFFSLLLYIIVIPLNISSVFFCDLGYK